MTIRITHPRLSRTADIDRHLGSYGSGPGPVVVVTAGLHGNEPAGIFAFLDLLEELQRAQPTFRGRVIGLAGNLPALEQNRRMIDADMNRLWHPAVLASSPPDSRSAGESAADDLEFPMPSGGAEVDQVRELYAELQQLLANETGPFFFVDLHTTSSVSPPFVPFDDTLINRRFVEQLPVPGILGIEEFLPGTLLSYMTRYRAVAIGYEAGQHEDPQSIVFHKALLGLVLEKAGCVSRADWPDLDSWEQMLRAGAAGLEGFFEVRQRYAIAPGEDFRMLPGFRSFQPVQRRQPLAANQRGPILAAESGRIFMPLYQAQGAEGFFLIRGVARFWLQLSTLLRSWQLDRVLALLPGVTLSREDRRTLTIDTRIAWFFAREIMHLMGYRQHVQIGRRIRFTRRD